MPAIVVAAPVIGISSLVVGNVLVAGFALGALWRLGSGALAAVGAYRRGDNAGAEGDFEAIGAGGADLAATVGPSLIGQTYSVLRRTEAGQALGQVVKGSAVGKAGNYGYAGSIENYQQTLNSALDAASQQIVSPQPFRDALCHCGD